LFYSAQINNKCRKEVQKQKRATAVSVQKYQLKMNAFNLYI